jgi:hypothetical protein
MKVLPNIKIIPVVYFLLQFLFPQRVPGQNQVNITEFLSQKFVSYCESVPREEIFVHTDREVYIAGEDLWFNINLIDRQSSHLSFNSKIVYFELLSPENKPVVQKRILLENGTGPGQIILPDSLSTGKYSIRAYTSWMKNFLPYNCFIKDIMIYNAFRVKSFKKVVYIPDGLEGKSNDTINIAENPGLVLKVNNFRPDTLEISVSADEKYRSEHGSLFYLFIQTHGIINLVNSGKMTGEQTRIAVPKTLLIRGINQITIFNAKGQPVSERYIYTPSVKEKQVITLLTADSCNTRSKVSLGLKIDDESAGDLNGINLSISVVPETIIPRDLELNEYMIFGTEYGLLPGRIMKGRKINDLPPELVDSLLANVASNWIRWKTILSDDPPEFKYKIEKEDHYITGLLLTNDQQLAYPGEFILLSTPGKVPLFQFTRTNYRAEFSFNIHIDEAVQDLIIQPDDLSKNNKIYFESSFSDQYLPSRLQIDSVSKPIPSYISKQNINFQVGRVYGSSSEGGAITRFFQPFKPKRFYGKPDAEILLKDYIKLPLMEEVFFEIVPHVALKKTGSDYEMSIVDAFGNRLFEEPPVTLIDGVIIKDPSVIANLDPELVEKIDVVRQRYFVGDYLFNGIVNVITKSADLANITLPDYVIRRPYRVIDPVVKFVSPDYSSPEMKNSRTPDFRNTLYWNPSVRPDKDGKALVEFWTSDVKSDYNIDIQGITPDGKTISFRKTIKVK